MNSQKGNAKGYNTVTKLCTMRVIPLLNSSLLGETVGLSPVECLVAEIGNDLKENQVAQPAEEGITDNVVARAGSECGTLHDISDKHGCNEVLATFQSLDGNLSNLFRSLGLVGLLELLGQLGLDLLLVVKSRAQNAHREDSVDLDIGSWGCVSVSLSVSAIVHLDLLAESVRQGANGSLGRRVGSVASDRNKCKSRTSED